jgi:hypothetical protein
MKDISFELEILSHYYDSEIIIDLDHMSMAVYEFCHKKTGKKYSYRLSVTDMKDFGPGVVKIINELKKGIRECKLKELGI